MIQANSLRIGNWLLFSNGITKPEYIKVSARFFSSLAGGRPLEELKDDEEISPYYSPIELSPDILTKAGFEKIQEGDMAYPEVWRIKYKSVLVTNVFDLQSRDSGEYSWIEGNTIVHNYYLHEIQNLYHALTGTNLTIQL